MSFSRFEALEHIIIHCYSKKIPNAFLVLQTAAELACSCDGNDKLSSGSANALRALVIQSLHGASPESSRDPVFSSLLRIMNQVSISWFLESDERTLPDTKILKNGTFMTFFFASIHNEIYLLVSEAIDIVPTIVLSRNQSSLYSDNLTLLLSRANRIDQMMLTCLDLFDNSLRLLLKDEVDDSIVDNNDLPLIEKVDVDSILAIKKSIQDTHNELFNYLKFVKSVDAKDLVRCTVRRICQSLCLWALQDDELLDPLCEVLCAVVAYSDIPLLVSDSLVETAVSDTWLLFSRDVTAQADVLFQLLPVLVSLVWGEEDEGRPQDQSFTHSRHLVVGNIPGLPGRLATLVVMTCYRLNELRPRGSGLCHEALGSCCCASDILVELLRTRASTDLEEDGNAISLAVNVITESFSKRNIQSLMVPHTENLSGYVSSGNELFNRLINNLLFIVHHNFP